MELTEKDFNLIIEALECLPNKHDAGHLMEDLLGTILCKDSDEDFKVKMEKQKEDYEKLKKELKEDTVILISKIVQMKRDLFPS